MFTASGQDVGSTLRLTQFFNTSISTDMPNQPVRYRLTLPSDLGLLMAAFPLGAARSQVTALGSARGRDTTAKCMQLPRWRFCLP